MENLAPSPEQHATYSINPQILSQSSFEFATILFEEYEKCKAINPRFSIRAFARKININPATLSSIFKGKRKLPRKHALDIVDRLKLQDGRRHRFLRSLKIEDTSSQDLASQAADQRKLLDPELHRQIIVDWEYYAVLHLLEIPQKWTAENVAQRLNISLAKTEEVLSGLEKAELIQKNQDYYTAIKHAGLRTTEEIPSEAIRLAHENELKVAMVKLHTVPVERRMFSSRTVTIDKRKLPQAKKAIQRFSQEIGDILTDHSKDDVYLLNIQLFPLTEEG